MMGNFSETLVIHLASGLLSNARFIPSPNFNYRPPDAMIDMVVIHNISLPPGEFGGPYIDALFTNSIDPTIHPFFAEIVDYKVSCHCLIRRDGTITQYVPFHLRAWHAGVSSFRGRDNCNDFSIGIELEGADEVPYAESQYKVLSDLIIVLQKTYPAITLDRIVGHDTIAPERKTDPGQSFDWTLLTSRLMENGLVV